MNHLPIDAIHPGDNDRTVFNSEDLDTLAASIREHGLIQPITVNQRDGFEYVIIAGERRWRACKLAGLTHIPAIVKQVSEEEAAALMLAENVSRKDLDLIDEALAYQKRIDKYGWTPEELARRVGVSSIKVQFRLKLLTLHPDLQHLVRSGNLQPGYAQIIAGAGLDLNRQMLSFKALRENPKPTPGWFRVVVNTYLQQQQQAGLFDTSALLVMQSIPVQTNPADPPHPSTTTPPVTGRGKAIIRNQIKFWNEAAAAWEAIGKPFKKQECQAAAQALTYLI